MPSCHFIDLVIVVFKFLRLPIRAHSVCACTYSDTVDDAWLGAAFTSTTTSTSTVQIYMIVQVYAVGVVIFFNSNHPSCLLSSVHDRYMIVLKTSGWRIYVPLSKSITIHIKSKSIAYRIIVYSDSVKTSKQPNCVQAPSATGISPPSRENYSAM